VVTGPKRDIAGDLSKAVKAVDLKMGFYYSLFEWYNPLWQKDKTKYVNEHFFPQIKNLVSRYKPDVLWADGEWDLTDEQWKSKELLAWLYNNDANKNMIVNDRWGKDIRKHHGGFYTTEYGADFSADHPWEECRGIGFSFGYNRNEDLQDYNSAQTLVLMLVNTVSNGGNLLLDIGPDESGKIPPIMQERLLQMGAWLKVNGEAIYGSRRWKTSFQWSEGKRDFKPVAEGGESGNFILKQTVAPDPGNAVKEAFFTTKNNSVYVILPILRKEIFFIKNISTDKNTVVTLLGVEKPLRWRKTSDGIKVYFQSAIKKLPEQYAYTLKITHSQ
jgi:alpha-L-fucosidase